MTWIKVTSPTSATILISVEQLVRVRPTAVGEFPHQAKAVVDLANGQVQATIETVDEVMRLIPPDA